MTVGNNLFMIGLIIILFTSFSYAQGKVGKKSTKAKPICVNIKKGLNLSFEKILKQENNPLAKTGYRLLLTDWKKINQTN